jgi:hypothetical protein
LSSGFNTDVRVGEQVFHVQTEDRGPAHPILDTVVYRNGMVLYRRSSNYESLAASPDFTPEALRQSVDAHHRAVIEELRSGALAGEIATAQEKAQEKAQKKAQDQVSEKTTGKTIGASEIQVQLLNAESWLTGGTVSLDIAIRRRANQHPKGGVKVEATIEGVVPEARHTGVSDDQGRVQIQFPLPLLGKGDLALVIRASTDAAKDEIRFAMRARPKSEPADAAQ